MSVTASVIEKAVEIQKEFEDRYANENGVVGIGIGLNARQDDVAINVQVSKEATADRLPKTFDGLDVVVDFVGHVHAL